MLIIFINTIICSFCGTVENKKGQKEKITIIVDILVKFVK